MLKRAVPTAHLVSDGSDCSMGSSRGGTAEATKRSDCSGAAAVSIPRMLQSIGSIASLTIFSACTKHCSRREAHEDQLVIIETVFCVLLCART